MDRFKATKNPLTLEYQYSHLPFTARQKPYSLQLEDCLHSASLFATHKSPSFVHRPCIEQAIKSRQSSSFLQPFHTTNARPTTIRNKDLLMYFIVLQRPLYCAHQVYHGASPHETHWDLLGVPCIYPIDNGLNLSIWKSARWRHNSTTRWKVFEHFRHGFCYRHTTL